VSHPRSLASRSDRIPAIGRLPPPAVRAADRALLFSAGALTAFLLLVLLTFGYGRDQGIYAVVADAMLRGGAPYRDAWDFKPPGIFFVFAATHAVLGSAAWAIRAIEALALASLLPAFAVLAGRFAGDRRAGWLAGALAVLCYVQLEFWNTAQPDGLGGILLAWALVAATRPPGGRPHAGGRRFAAWFVCAALYATAALLKPPLGGGILVSLGFVLSQEQRRSGESDSSWWRAPGPPLAAFALGGALPVLATLLWFAAHGALDELVEVLFGFAPHYTGLRLRWERLPVFLLESVRIALVGITPHLAVGLLAMALLPPLGPRERRGMLQVLGVVAFVLVGAALQAKFFRYHFAPALLLLSLPAGLGYWKLWLRARGTLLGWATAAALVAALHAGWLPLLPDMAWFWERTGRRLEALQDPTHARDVLDELHRANGMSAPANRRAAEWLVRHTRPDERLYVWGFEPVLYHWSGRIPASRYVYNVPQRADWGRGRESARERLLAELEAADPAAVVVVSRDPFPDVVGHRRGSAQELESFPDLERWIDSRYRRAAQIEDLDIRLRRDLVDRSEAP